ncbi:hypothetical protein ElyMa_000489700 [Elysia marginata]|uniref:Uncharacterized protein n=1 Tax=Elysia marginata TaxID=1093978 RepID=A0AAV4FTN7_9GAST|nr:hypothetical protein ElyMa_000489700 [Elysia marginata]
MASKRIKRFISEILVQLDLRSVYCQNSYDWITKGWMARPLAKESAEFVSGTIFSDVTPGDAASKFSGSPSLLSDLISRANTTQQLTYIKTKVNQVKKLTETPDKLCTKAVKSYTLTVCQIEPVVVVVVVVEVVVVVVVDVIVVVVVVVVAAAIVLVVVVVIVVVVVVEVVHVVVLLVVVVVVVVVVVFVIVVVVGVVVLVLVLIVVIVVAAVV